MNHAKPTRNFAWYYLPLEWLLLGLSSLPMPVLYVVADGFYLLLRFVLRYRQKVVLQNLRNSFPEKSEAEITGLQHGFYRHFADLIVEILKLATISKEELSQRVTLYGHEQIAHYFDQNRTVITFGSHAGNWEWILPAGALFYPGKLDGVYKPLNNKFFDYFVYRLRSRTGAGLVPMRETVRHMEERRGQGNSLCMLSDQSPQKSKYAYWTTLLHQDTAFYTGADRLAVQFNCPVFYGSIRRIRRGYYGLWLEQVYDGESPLDLSQHPITEAFARRIERDIRERPTDYLWSHRRWKLKKD
ncbi:lysophospholipid acyltransferase family protein [Hymenobacter sp. CRA2]|uniref:lysophospholipid acyltransferase family protein n=1 Tax=Hymenobacter sp. CRA2 TaxID=1955620 RepID=UPI0009C929A0|nr:lysophospholipid acyltransferase family protein [Hymenobacter sp. CRA2]OON68721.1 lauroyl acyltransferase [Hymenobacter sp. CRA2]